MGRDRASLTEPHQRTSRPPKERGRLAAIGGLITLAFLVVFVVWPLVAVFVRSFADVGPGRLADIIARPSIVRVLWFTTAQALGSTALTLLVGLPVAQVLARYRFTGRRAVRAVVVVPFVLPTVVVASAFAELFDRLPGLTAPSLGAVLAAHVFFNVAVVVRIVGGFWARADRRLEESARVLGASRWRAFRAITLSRLAPVLAAASVLVFLFSFTSFGIIQILGGPARATVETEIYRYAVRRIEFDIAAVLALIQVVAVLALATVSAHLQRRMTTFDHGRARPLATRPTTFAERLHIAAGLTIVVLVVAVPVGVLVEGSLSTSTGYGFDNYRRLFETGDLLPVSAARALATSIGFAAIAALVATVIGLLAAVAVTRGGRLGRALEALTLVPLGVSAVTLGFGYLVGFTVFDLRRSVWLVPLSHAVIGLPFVLAAVVPAMRSIDPHLREAAATLGAAPSVVQRRVDWPLVRGAAVTGAGFAAAVSIGEFGATSFLARGQESFTAPLAVFRLVSQPGAVLRGQALALSVIIGVLVAAIAALIEWRRADGVTLL